MECGFTCIGKGIENVYLLAGLNTPSPSKIFLDLQPNNASVTLSSLLNKKMSNITYIFKLSNTTELLWTVFASNTFLFVNDNRSWGKGNSIFRFRN
jgi:hypothetical protein